MATSHSLTNDGRKSAWLAALVMSSTALCACGSADAIDLADPSSPELTVRMRATVVDENQNVVEGLEVCALDRPDIPCVTSDAEGQIGLALAEDEDLILSYEHPDFVPMLRMLSTGGAMPAYRVWTLYSRAGLAERAERVGITVDPSKAIVVLQAPGHRDLTMTLTPTRGDGPFYLDEDFTLDSELTATDLSGTAIYANVEPSEVEAAFHHPTKSCAPAGWNGSSDSAVYMVAEPGTITAAWIACDL